MNKKQIKLTDEINNKKQKSETSFQDYNNW